MPGLGREQVGRGGERVERAEALIEPVSLELSRTRIRSPPMFEGRKLLKKVATR
jgi:hypothetical protein